MPKPKRKLTVFRVLFKGLIFATVGDRRISFNKLQEARQYAADHKYHGIKVKFL